MPVIYGKCINRFCKVTGPGGIKYTEYDTSGSLVQIMAGGRGISATECASNREGLLCGQCKKGYSLTMYYMVSFKFIAPSIRRPRGSTDDYKTSPPLPSPDRHMKITRYTRGVLVERPTSYWRTFVSSYRFHVCIFHIGILTNVVDDVLINFFQGRSGFLFIFQNYFLQFGLVLPWWSNNLENFVEKLLHLTIDQHPLCPNRAPAWILTSKMAPFRSKSVTLSM